MTPIADPASVRIRRSEPIQKSDPYRSFGGLKSVTPVANLSLHWRPQKCDPYRRFASSMRPRPQFGDPYRSFVDPADPDEIRWARNCDTYRTIRLVRGSGWPPPRIRMAATDPSGLQKCGRHGSVLINPNKILTRGERESPGHRCRSVLLSP